MATVPDAPMSGQLLDRVVVVTGAARGIGQVIAVAMSAEGARVVATARDLTALSDTMAQIDKGGGAAWARACDVTDEASVDAMSRRAEDWLGRVDSVVANAGIAGPTRLMHEL